MCHIFIFNKEMEVAKVTLSSSGCDIGGSPYQGDVLAVTVCRQRMVRRQRALPPTNFPERSFRKYAPVADSCQRDYVVPSVNGAVVRAMKEVVFPSMMNIICVFHTLDDEYHLRIPHL